jgi:riboflavin kinase/FMN adenylyltransferase
MQELSGVVIEGDKIAGTLGYPTANLEVTGETASHGIYAGWVLLDDGEFPAIAIIGVDDKTEIHILDWEGDLYGKQIAMSLVDKVRDIEDYTEREELLAQIERDIESVKELLDINV